jgi:outer membrane protein assembly factor BamB
MTGWRHFGGNLSNQGFVAVKSRYAVSPAWKSGPFKITSASPVIGRDPSGAESLYVGTADSQLVALDAQTGRLRWSVTLATPGATRSSVATPAVDDAGGVVVMSVSELPGGRLQGSLHKVDREGNPLWSYSFPDGAFSTGSPKAFTFAGQSLVLVQVTTGSAKAPRSELFVLRDTGAGGELLGRAGLAQCPAGSGFHTRALLNWRLLAAFPARAGTGSDDPAALDPTPAVGLGRAKPLIAAVDNLCGAGVFEWDGREISPLWQSNHSGDSHSSPVIIANHLMVYGGRAGRLLAYDAETGVKMWEYDAGEPILATPSGSGDGVVYAVSVQHLHAVRADNGATAGPAGSEPGLKIPGPTLASAAVTSECVYVPAQEMLSLSHDFKVRSHNTAFSGNGISSPAVGGDGSVYVVAMDGSVWKYKGGS